MWQEAEVPFQQLKEMEPALPVWPPCWARLGTSHTGSQVLFSQPQEGGPAVLLSVGEQAQRSGAIAHDHRDGKGRNESVGDLLHQPIKAMQGKCVGEHFFFSCFPIHPSGSHLLYFWTRDPSHPSSSGFPIVLLIHLKSQVICRCSSLADPSDFSSISSQMPAIHFQPQVRLIAYLCSLLPFLLVLFKVSTFPTLFFPCMKVILTS